MTLIIIMATYITINLCDIDVTHDVTDVRFTDSKRNILLSYAVTHHFY